MNGKSVIHFTGISIIMLIFLLAKIIPFPEEMQDIIYISSFGFLALTSLMFVLLIPLIYKIKAGRAASFLLANRRWIGVYTFIFALVHALLVFELLFDWNISKAVENPYRVLGLIAFMILALMAVTSNDYSMKMLRKNWKRLHFFAYAALILLIIHSFSLGLVFMKIPAIRIIFLMLLLAVIWRMINKFRKK